MGEFVKVAEVSLVPPGQAAMVEVQGRQIALSNLDGTFYAINNDCTHAGGSLSEGLVEGDHVECPWHGARFNVKTGAKLSAPAPADVAAYKCRVNGSAVEIEL